MIQKRSSARRSLADDMDDRPYIRNENGELVPYYGQYVEDANGNAVSYVPPPRERFTQEARERARRNRDRRHDQRWWLKILVDIVEGRVTMTREQLQAHIAIGRSKGWNRRLPPRQ